MLLYLVLYIIYSIHRIAISGDTLRTLKGRDYFPYIFEPGLVNKEWPRVKIHIPIKSETIIQYSKDALSPKDLFFTYKLFNPYN